MSDYIKRRDDVNPEEGERKYGDTEFADMRAAYDALLGQYSKGLIKAHVSAAYPLADAAQALEEIRTGRVKGKVVLTTEAR